MSSSFHYLSLLLLWFSYCGLVLAVPHEDLIESLPSYGIPPTAQYSGYLNGTDGCDTETNGDYCYIHYWFATSTLENDNDDIPVVLWLNGGPGSSSILGFLQEVGPLLMNNTGGLMDNPYAWTQVAHVFAMESPIGVGYSYCANQEQNNSTCQNSDTYTASTSRAALVDFFTTKFPELASNPFYITGESYAGVYIPTLAKEIVDDAVASSAMNLMGLAVGDPCTDNTAQMDSMDSLWYSHKYGLIDDAVFDTLWNTCKIRSPTILARQQQQQQLSSKLSDDEEDDDTMKHMSKECKLAYRKFMLSSSHGLSQGWKDLFIDDYSLFAPTTNMEDDDMTTYMNREDVRRALHVDTAPIKNWPLPNQGFDYTKQYDACNDEPTIHESMIQFYQYLAPKLDGSIYVYNGDTDPCVSYEGTRTAIKRVGYSELDGGSYRPWFYVHDATSIDVIREKAVMFGPDLLSISTGVQFGGEIVDYEHKLSFLTVHGSGHMVPQFRPQAALHMLSKLLQEQPLSPLLPTNATLEHVCSMEFSDMMNNWTETAKNCPYICTTKTGEDDNKDTITIAKE